MNGRSIQPDRKRFLKMAIVIAIFSILTAALLSLIIVGKLYDKCIIYSARTVTIEGSMVDSQCDGVLVLHNVDPGFRIQISIQIFVMCAIIILLINIGVLFFIKKCIIEPMIKRMILEQKRLSEDNLTGLCRRDVLDGRIDIYNHKCDSLAVLYIDVNNLKEINDEYGHAAGDELLERVASAIRSLRGEYSDLDHFRLGGDEFIVIIKNPTEDRARELSRILAKKFALIRIHRAHSKEASVAVGFAYSRYALDVETLINQADSDMYKNKMYMKSQEPQ